MLGKFKHNFSIFNKKVNFKNSLLKKKLNKLNSLFKIKLSKLNSLFKIKLSKLNSLFKIKLSKLIFYFGKKKLSVFTSFNRISLFVFGTILLIFFYVSIPYFYNTNNLINKIENELSNNLNIVFNLSDDFSYSFFPRPYFTFKKVAFLNKSKNFGNLKVDIPISKLLFVKNIEIRDVVLSNVNFNINKENYNFFIELLKNDFSNFKFEIKKSNIFYNTIENEILFINKINYLKFYYNKKKSSNFLIADNEIFNLLYNIEFNNDFVNKKIKSVIDFSSLNLKIENNFNYKDSKKEGLTNFFYNKKKSKITYNYRNNFFEFNFFDRLVDPSFNYKGTINLKPFFSESLGSFKEINSKEFLNPNSFLLQFLKTEILNNKNLNMNNTLNVKQIDKFEDFINLVLKITIREGLIDIDETTISWLDNIDFKISDSLIYMNDNNLVLDALIEIQIKNHKELYKFFQTPRYNRKEVKIVKFDLTYNFDQFTANLNNIRIDGLIDPKINKTLKQIILKDNRLQNRIYFKNLLNQAIKLYAG